jgi:hypothetical protein
VAEDGSCRPVWLAMKTAAAAGQVETLTPQIAATAEFGVWPAVVAGLKACRLLVRQTGTVTFSPGAMLT